MFNSILFLSFALLLPFVVDSLYFNFTSFRQGDPGNIMYHGDAVPDENGTVNFNNGEKTSHVGWITYAEKVPIWSPKTGKASDFNTSFSFKIDARNLSAAGHGICFFLAPMGAQLPAYTVGGFLGLFTSEDVYSSSFQLVHVEFDTFNDPSWDPKNVGSHVGINNNSLVSSNYTSWNASLHSQDICHAKISYDSVTKNLTVTWAYERTTSDSKENSSLSYIIDLAKVLPSEVMLGFIAAAGANTEEHRLLSWELSSSLDSDKANSKIGLLVGLSVSGIVFLTFLVFTTAVIWSRKQRRKRERDIANVISIDEDLEREAGPRKFSYKDLESATNRFSDHGKLGKGGFGTVYSGNLKGINTMVAVKKLSCGSRQGQKEFLNEVKIISRLRHRNLVKLIGWCNEKDEFLLIYELMPNGSLNSHLFGKSPHILSWNIRYKIALGLASALLYLHEEWDQCVLHRDIKASNIMLDTDFNVKLGDFGLARLMNHELGSHTTGLAGTFGYMAPEYVMKGSASKESDIYSFGIVLLEIVTGKKSLEHHTQEEDSDTESDEKILVEKVWELYGKQEVITSYVDEQLGKDFDKKEAECLVVVGLWCAHPDKNSRPSIKQVIQVLNFESPLPDLPLKRPVAMYYVSTSSSSVNSSGVTASFSSIEYGR